MKVYIGPYRNTWWNTQRVWKKWLEWNHKKSYWQIEEEDHTKWDKRVDKTLDWWHDHINVPLNKLWFHKRKRKIKIRIDNYDIWNMDYTLSLIIVPMLKELKNTKHGVPSEFTDRIGGDFDRNLVFDFIKEDEDKVFDQLCDKWDEVLDLNINFSTIITFMVFANVNLH